MRVNCPHWIDIDKDTYGKCSKGLFGGTPSVGTCHVCLSNADLPVVDNSCPEHISFCPKFFIKTSSSACAICSEERNSDPYFAQQLFSISMLSGTMACKHMTDSGQTKEQICCGGQKKTVPIYVCALTGKEPNCTMCQDKEI